jgi:hypothetical protein
MLGAVNSVAGLLGTADRSTNIEVVPGATDLFTGEEQETVITTMHVAAVTANSLR